MEYNEYHKHNLGNNPSCFNYFCCCIVHLIDYFIKLTRSFDFLHGTNNPIDCRAFVTNIWPNCYNFDRQRLSRKYVPNNTKFLLQMWKRSEAIIKTCRRSGFDHKIKANAIRNKVENLEQRKNNNRKIRMSFHFTLYCKQLLIEHENKSRVNREYFFEFQWSGYQWSGSTCLSQKEEKQFYSIRFDSIRANPNLVLAEEKCICSKPKIHALKEKCI